MHLANIVKGLYNQKRCTAFSPMYFGYLLDVQLQLAIFNQLSNKSSFS